MVDPSRPQRRRVFFGLAPDAETRAAVVDATRTAVTAAGGRPIAVHNLHMTLAFLGGVTPAQLDKARGIGPLSAATPFTLTLDRLGYWSRSQILWLGPSDPPAALMALERELWRRLEARRFERERGRFRPHMTLARRARAARAAMRSVRWDVSCLTLFESVQDERGARYERLAEWPLGD